MKSETNWLDTRICDLPNDINGKQLLAEMTQALDGVAESLHPYRGVLAETVSIDLDRHGEDWPVKIRAVVVAQSSDGAVLYYDTNTLCGLDVIGEKRRWIPLLSIDDLVTAGGHTNLRFMFEPPSPVHIMTSRDLIKGINALKQRLKEVASAGPSALEEFRHLLND